MLKENKFVQLGSVVVSASVTAASTCMLGKVFDILMPEPYKGAMKVIVKVGKLGLEAGIGKAVWDASMETCNSIIEIVDGVKEGLKKEPKEAEGESA